MQLTDEQLSNRVKIVESMIDEFDEPRRSLVKSMMSSQVGMSFYTSPASSREEYHSCYPGGLMTHSLNVVRYLLKLNEIDSSYDRKTLIFVGLFHDIGKTGDCNVDYYLPNNSAWHRERGILYEINKECKYMLTSDRGLFIMQNHGIKLSYDEFMAIKLNDGMYDDANRSYGMNEPKLALLTHWADMMACKHEKSL